MLKNILSMEGEMFMMLPDRIFDDMFDFGEPRPHGPKERMDCDIYEKDGNTIVEASVPGFKKDEITLTLEKGTLTVAASKGLDKDEKNDKGRVIRQERYAGSMQRSFFVGRNVTEDEIKAKFEDGVLKLTVPKKEAAKVPEKKTIMIEG